MVGFKIIFVFVLCSVWAQNASAAVARKAQKVTSCESFLGANLQPDPMQKAAHERRELIDLLRINPSTGQLAKDNLVRQHPMIILSAGQRIYAMIQSDGFTEVLLKHQKRSIKRWHLFSKPSKINGGRFIIGQERALEELVSGVKNFVHNDEKLVPSLVGPHGTGKSLFMDIFTNALKYLSLNEERYYMWTYDWIDLHEVPGLKLMGPDPHRADLNDSPFALLPQDLQKLLLEKLEKDVIKWFDVGAPRGALQAVPQNRYIANKILEFARNQKGQDLSPLEEIQALNKHIILRRLVLGDQSSGTLPTIDAQGGVNWDISLFVRRRPKMAALLHDERNPLVWSYGKVASGHGTAVKFDEYFRNPADFRDIMLRLSQDRKMEIGGAPSVDLDMFILSAFNQTSLEKAREDNDSKAHIDRLNMINMLWSVYPHEIMKTMLFMKFFNQDGGENISVRALGQKKAQKIKTQSLEELFPIWAEGEALRTTDYRYELWVGNGSQEVHISPHTLLYMASVAALTRLNFDVAKANQFKQTKVTATPVYRDPYMRLTWLLGMSDEVQAQAGVTETLVELHHLTKEGNFGMSARDLSQWFNMALDLARENQGRDLTITTASKAFHIMLEQDKFEFDASEGEGAASEAELRLRWKSYVEIVAAKLVLPRISADVSASRTNSNTVFQNYSSLLAMISVLSQDDTADSYLDPQTKEKKKISHKFLEAIKEVYARVNGGERLDYSQIASWMLNANIRPGDAVGEEHGRRHRGLDAAVREYLQDVDTERFRWLHISDAVSGKGGSNEETAALAEKILNNLRVTKGYTLFGAKEAINLTAQSENYLQEMEDKEIRRSARTP